MSSMYVVSFTTSPVNMTVPINTTASFSCTPSFGFGDQVTWIIRFPNSSQNLLSSVNLVMLETRGFIFTYNDNMSFVNVSASALNNGSRLECRGVDSFLQNIYSEAAFLTVVGEDTDIIVVFVKLIT